MCQNTESQLEAHFFAGHEKDELFYKTWISYEYNQKKNGVSVT